MTEKKTARIVIEYPGGISEDTMYFHSNFPFCDQDEPIEVKKGEALPTSLAYHHLLGSQLCGRLLEIDGVKKTTLSRFQLTIYKYPAWLWTKIEPAVLSAVKQTYNVIPKVTKRVSQQD